MLSILEREDDFAGEPGIDFVDPVNVDQRGAVNAQEARWVEAALELEMRSPTREAMRRG